MSENNGSAVALTPVTGGAALNVLSFTHAATLMGVPTLEAIVDIGDKPAPTGAQVLSYAVQDKPALLFKVFIVESHVSVGRATLFAVGGAGGMRESVAGRDYGEVSPRLVAEDILANPVTSDGIARPEFGDAAALAMLDALPHLARWSRPSGSARAAATRLAGKIGMSWRTLRSGLVWFGVETWPAYAGGAAGQPYFIDEPDAYGLATLALDAPDLEPGMTIKPTDDAVKLATVAGTVATPLKVSDVIHSVDEGGSFRTRVRIVPPEGVTRGRFQDQFRRAVEGALPPMSLRTPWFATVISQDSDGTLGLRLEPEAPLLTLSGVPIWAGWPGLKIQVPSGAQCIVEFTGGRESSPIVRSFAPDTPVTLVKFNDGTAQFSRVGDGVDCGIIQVTAPPGGGICAILYASPGHPFVGITPTPLSGSITSGSPKFTG